MAVVADDDRGRSVTEVGLVGAAREAGAQVGGDGERGAGLGGRGAQRTHGAPQRTHDVVGTAILGQAQCAMDGGRIGPVQVWRRRRGEPDGVEGQLGVRRRATRAASTARVVASWSYDATARVPLRPPPPATSATPERSSRQ